MPWDDVEEFTLAGDGAGATAGDGADQPRASARPRARSATRLWRGPLPWACCAVVLVLLGVLVAPPQPDPVGPWGTVEDVSSAPVQAWQHTDAGTIRSALMTDEALVVVHASEVAGLDVASGERMWTHPLDHGTCTTDGHTVVCADGGDRAVEWAPDTGATLAEIAVDEAAVATRAQGDWFVVSGNPGGQEDKLARYSGGQEVWSTAVLAQVPQVPFGNTLAVVAGSVLLTTARTGTDGPASGAVVDAATGKPQREAGVSAGIGVLMQTAPGVWTAATRDGGTRYVRGRDSPATVSSVAAQMVYDGQQGADHEPRFLGTDGGYGMFDTSTDQWDWRVPGPGRPIARLDGALLSLSFTEHGPPTMAGRDVTSGEQLWQQQGTWLECPCIADAHTLAMFRTQLRTEPSGALTVRARELVGLQARTGEELWALDAPRSTFALLTDGARLIAVGPALVQAWELG